MIDNLPVDYDLRYLSYWWGGMKMVRIVNFAQTVPKLKTSIKNHKRHRIYLILIA